MYSSNLHKYGSAQLTGGFCIGCSRYHFLPQGEAVQACRRLMWELELKGRIDFQQPDNQTDPRYSTEYLFGEARGKMFGVLSCRTPRGDEVLLRAFSGQYNGRWHVPGWVGPVFDLKDFNALVGEREREIKAFSNRIAETRKGTRRYVHLVRKRKILSQSLMREIHGLYTLKNFQGQQASLCRVFSAAGAPPAGTGDCCAPKLIHQAIQMGLQPLSIAEFYWGRENRSKSRRHGKFYPACTEKCQPILGFQLCGLTLSGE